MATANGSLTPPSLPPASSSPSPSPAKRKRTDTDTGAHVANGASTPATGKLLNGASHSLQSVLEDIVLVLKGYDTQPSILTRPITSSATRTASGEADAKRTKLTPPAASTITSLIEDGAYDSFEALEKDVENASADILASIGSSELDTVPSTPKDTRLQAQVLAFQKMLRTLVHREEVRRANVEAKKRTADQDGGIKVETPAPVKREPLESCTVLTLFGSAQGPKQLFSSLQQPRAIPSSGQSSALDTSVKVTLPLRESTLPNIISTTDVFPLSDDVDEKKKETATIGKLFKAPPHLPQLSPPKLAKTLTTKGSTVTFAHPEAPKPSRKASLSYANQPLSAGSWLGYGGVDMPKDPTSPTAKQKSRQRALSTGAGEQPPSELTLAAVKQAKEDALFRSAYSSFAPTRDNASAIIPEETKNMVWWQKVGEKRFNEVFPIDPDLLQLGTSPVEDGEGIDENEEEEFKAAVENFEPVDESAAFKLEEKSALEKNTEEVLEEISELLETLASHQRIRNSSLATNPRTPVIQNASLANLAGSPSTPSTEEVDVYEILKAQLTMMILQLPPYALAKLNGDQLEELNISRTILIENKDTRGVLEEDQASRLAKASAASATAQPSLSRMPSSTSGSHYPGNQYGRSTPVHNSVRPVQASTSFFSQQQPTHRSPSVHQYPRSSSNVQPGYQAPAASFPVNPRPSSYNSSSYPQQTPRATHVPAANNAMYPQSVGARSTNYGGAAASQYYPNTSQTPSHVRYPNQQPQQQNGYYPPRPQNVAPMYNNTPGARTASPLKAAPSNGVTQPNYGPTRAGGFGTPVSGSGGHMRTYYAPSQYGNTQPHTPIASAATATPGYTANPQQMMLDRQQVQQPQARLAAQNSFSSRAGSGTPQPGANGGFAGQQPNGTMT
ncbi:hypothetical protein CC80DRAFT_492240 [Byssothecium circinans]|uniref:Uncharacterized protein n=1 Tax=Byssothecium circinans TaxID=147558 RepID=A0A6A5U143_9PLEO|nr:hypothetical protein CC80DRAFT_492240 [Byssothecium circinans]